MEGVQHPGRVRQRGPQRGGVTAERVQRGHRDRRPATAAVGRRSTGTERFPTASRHDVEQPRTAVTSTIPVTNSVWCRPFAARNAVSSTPSACTPASRAGSSTSGVPYSTTAAITVPQATPNSAATWATECPSSPTRRHASTRARSVSDARGRIAGEVSDQVTTGQRRLDGTARPA